MSKEFGYFVGEMGFDWKPESEKTTKLTKEIPSINGYARGIPPYKKMTEPEVKALLAQEAKSQS